MGTNGQEDICGKKRREYTSPIQNFCTTTSQYANVIWGPIYKGDQKSVEAVQRRETKLILIISHLPYEGRLCHLNLPSLQHRRRRGDNDHSI